MKINKLIKEEINKYINNIILEDIEFFKKKHDIDEKECGLGFSEKEQKWYGWSHRAVYGFGIGSKVKKGDCGYDGKEWTAKTLEDAKKMAKNFAKSVS